MADQTHVNLWECLTSTERNHRKDICGPKVTSELLMALGRSARFHMQEISLDVTEEGWQIKIFGCDPQDYGDEIIILIPKDATEPVKVRKDCIGRREYHHDQHA